MIKRITLAIALLAFAVAAAIAAPWGAAVTTSRKASELKVGQAVTLEKSKGALAGC